MKKIRSRLATTRSKHKGIIRPRRQKFIDIADVPVEAMKARIESAMPDYVARVREWAANALRAAGLPDTLRHVQRHPDGNWSELPADLRKALDDLPDTYLPESFWNDPDWDAAVDQIKGASITVTNAASLVGEPPADEQALPIEWHAWQLLDSVAALERAIAAGDAQRAAAAGIELGGRWQQAIFAERFEKFAAIGIKQSESGSDGGNAGGRPGIDKAWVQAIADEVWRETPGLSPHAAAKEVREKIGSQQSVRNICRLIKKPA